MSIPNRTVSNIQVRRGTSTAWTANNPTLLEGEIGFETDFGRLKVGDGISAWQDLDYIDASLDDIISQINNHTHDASDIVSGTIDIERLPSASDSVAGIVEFATDIETQALSDDSIAITPAGLASLTPSTTRLGLVEQATESETRGLADTERYITPQGLGGVLGLVSIIPSSVSGGTADATGRITPSGTSDRIDVRNVFDQGFREVIIQFYLTFASNDGIWLRLRSGSVSTGNNYDTGYDGWTGSASTGSQITAQQYWIADAGASADRHWGRVFLFDAGEADFTFGDFQGGARRPSASIIASGSRSFFHTLETSYDGFRIQSSSGSDFTGGFIRVYGMN